MRCKDAVLPACFYFPRAAACLIFSILACFDSESIHTHTHFRPGVGLARGRGRDQLRCSNVVQQQ